MTIDKSNPNHIFVFGSNTEGRHGKGAALFARENHGAIYGKPSGLQGRSYGIITKDLRVGKRSVPLKTIWWQLVRLSVYARSHSHLTFFITKIGTNHAGFTETEIKELIDRIAWPSNCVLPDW